MEARAEAGWNRLKIAFLSEDGNKIKDVKEDIDTLLVFVCDATLCESSKILMLTRRDSFPLS